MNHHRLRSTRQRQAATVANARLSAMLPLRRRSAAVAVAVHNEDEANNGASSSSTEEPEESEYSTNNVRNDDSDSLISEQGSDASTEEPEESECSICYECPSADNVATIGGCAHRFCLDCITTWSERNNVCPLCRVRFTSIESTGGVLHQVPDRRPTGGRNIVMNFVSLFNLEVEDGMDPFDVVMDELNMLMRMSVIRLEARAALRDQRVVEVEPDQMHANLQT